MRLLLSGGGRDMALLDTFFASHIDLDQTVLYIPVAADESERPYKQCLKDFQRRYAPYGITKIEMCTDLSRAAADDGYTAMYIDGGNTYKLLKEIRESNFHTAIFAFLQRGGFIYGNSAGSIVFGRDIKPTTFEDENEVGWKDSSGLNLVNGFNVCCHFSGKENRAYKWNRIMEYACSSKGTIALPDDCGIFVENEKITFMGNGCVFFPGGRKNG